MAPSTRRRRLLKCEAVGDVLWNLLNDQLEALAAQSGVL
jgi:hypothetical protein